MALIRKYNTGGSFKDYVNEKLIKGGLTNKSFQYINDSLNTFDPNGTYEGEIKKNWAGQDIADSPELANIYLANLHKEYQQVAPKQQTDLTPEGGWKSADRSIGSLMGYISKKDYDGNEDYALKQIAKMTDNQQVKKYIASKAKDLLNDYSSKASTRPEDNWENIDNIRNIQNVISSINTNSDISDEDWEKVSSFTNKLGWQVDDFLISDEVFDERKRALTEKTENQNRENVLNLFRERGISDENLQNQLYQSGYRKEADLLKPYLTDYFSKKGYSVFGDESGKNYAVLNGNELVTSDFGLLSEDQFSEDYGKTFSIQDGRLVFNESGALPEGFELPQWKDDGNRGKELLSSDPEYSNYVITGYSRDDFQGNYDKDIFGRRDYTGQLTFTDALSGNRFTVEKNEDGKYYKEDGSEFKVPKLTGYAGTQGQILENIQATYLDNPNSIFNGIKARNHKINLRDAENTLAKVENQVKRSRVTGNFNDLNNKEFKKLVENIAYSLANIDSTPGDKELIKKLAARLHSVGSERLDPNDENSNLIFTLKQGGIIKAQEGISFAELASKKNRGTSSSGNSEEAGGKGKIISVTDVSNAWKNSSGLQKASVFASAASMVPVLGVVGGATSTVLDALEGRKDGWDRSDWGTLAGNLGFTALSAIGFGATKAGKLVMQANKAAKAARTAGTAGKVAKETAKVVDASSDFLKAANKAAKLGADPKIVDTLKAASKTGAKVGDDVFKLADDILKTKTTWVGSHTEGIGDAVKAAGKFMAEKAPLVGKAAKWGMVGQAGITGVAGASDLVGNMISDGFIEGFKNTDIDSIRKATQLGAVGRSAYMNRKYSKAAGKYIKMEGETPQRTVVTVGDKKIAVDGEHLKKYTSNWEKVKGTAKQSIRESNKKTFLTDLKTKVSKQDQKVIDDILKQEGKLGKIEFEFTKSSGGNPVLARDPESLSYKDRQKYNIAKKIYQSGQTRYGAYTRGKQPIIYESEIAEQTAKATATKAASTVKNTTAQTLGVKGAKVKTKVNQEVDLAKLFKNNRAVRTAIKKHYGPNVSEKDLGKIKPSQLNMKHDKKGLYQTLKRLKPSKQQGGILKFQQSGIIPRINDNLSLPDWMKTPIQLRYNSSPSSTSNNLRYTNPTVSKNTFDFATKFPLISSYTGVNPSTTGTSTAGTSTTRNVDLKDDSFRIDNFEVQPFNPKQYRNITPITETLKLLAANRGNKRNTEFQVRAAGEIPKLSTMSYTHLPTSSIYTNLANKQAGDIMSYGNRVARATSDTSLGLSARLSSQKNASDTILQGQYKDIENNLNTRNRQLDMNNRVDEYNRNIVNQESQLGAQARRSMNIAWANEESVKGHSLQNYLGHMGREVAMHPYKKAMWEYQQESSNPNITEAQRYEAYLLTEGKDQAKKAYDNYYANLDKTSPDYLNKPTFENSEQYELWQEQVNQHKKRSNSIMSRYNTLGKVVQSTMPYMQRGGKIPLSEKIALENVKYNHKRLLKENELYYKQLMENNKLVQKALLKVFK